jgi:hypothetical protein
LFLQHKYQAMQFINMEITIRSTQHDHPYYKNIQWLSNDVQCAANCNQNTFTPRHTLYPTRGIFPSSRPKPALPYEHNPLPFSSYQCTDTYDYKLLPMECNQLYSQLIVIVQKIFHISRETSSTPLNKKSYRRLFFKKNFVIFNNAESQPL